VSFWKKARGVLRDAARLRPLIRLFAKDKTVVGKIGEIAETVDKAIPQ